MTFDDLHIRCHAIGKIMTESREKITDKQLEQIAEFRAKPKLTVKQEDEYNRLIAKRDNPPALSDTCESYLRQLYREQRWARNRSYSSKYIEKGLREEEASISLLSLKYGVMMRKNTERKSNAYIEGEPDIQPVLIGGLKTGFDVKTCWDLFTMPFPDEKLDPAYEWQNRGYIELFGADQWVTAYCLVNAPGSLIWREKEKVLYTMGTPKPGDDMYVEYMKECVKIEINMIVDIEQYYRDNPPNSLYNDLEIKQHTDWSQENKVFDIPAEERIVEFTTKRDPVKANAIYEKVKACRKFMNENSSKWEIKKRSV